MFFLSPKHTKDINQIDDLLMSILSGHVPMLYVGHFRKLFLCRFHRNTSLQRHDLRLLSHIAVTLRYPSHNYISFDSIGFN